MIQRVKQVIHSIPGIGPGMRAIYRGVRRTPVLAFRRSDQYWEDRYRRGGNSGSGSYGRLAAFKAEVLNEFVAVHGITSVVEFGCGDGAQLRRACYPKYTGFDVSPTAVEFCRQAFAQKPGTEFFLCGSDEYDAFQPVDLALSLDVIFHLVEDDIYEAYMRKLFRSARRYVIIYAYDCEKVYKARHERGRAFTGWIEQNEPKWRLCRRVANRYPFDPQTPDSTSQADFFMYERCPASLGVPCDGGDVSEKSSMGCCDV